MNKWEMKDGENDKRHCGKKRKGCKKVVEKKEKVVKVGEKRRLIDLSSFFNFLSTAPMAIHKSAGARRTFAECLDAASVADIRMAADRCRKKNGAMCPWHSKTGKKKGYVSANRYSNGRCEEKKKTRFTLSSPPLFRFFPLFSSFSMAMWPDVITVPSPLFFIATASRIRGKQHRIET